MQCLIVLYTVLSNIGCTLRSSYERPTISMSLLLQREYNWGQMGLDVLIAEKRYTSSQQTILSADWQQNSREILTSWKMFFEEIGGENVQNFNFWRIFEENGGGFSKLRSIEDF